jgi:hypothetical protein
VDGRNEWHMRQETGSSGFKRARQGWKGEEDGIWVVIDFVGFVGFMVCRLCGCGGSQVLLSCVVLVVDTCVCSF